MTAAPAPLDGIRVLELGGWLAGPLTGRLLADLGAQVTRIAPPGPPRLSPALDRALAADKRVLTVDLRDAPARADVLDHIRGSDVVVENAQPGATARLGLDAAALRVAHPRLVWLSLPGYAAEDVHNRGLPAWEVVLGAAGGLFTDTSPTRGLIGLPPSFTALPLASVYAAVHGAIGVVAALLARERDGTGDTIEAPLAAALAAAMGSVLMELQMQPARYDVPPLPAPVKRALPTIRKGVARAPRAVQERVGAAARAAVPPLMDSYRCADGELLYLFALDHDRLPVVLLDHLGVLEELRAAGLGEHPAYGPARRDNVLDATLLSPIARVRLRRAVGRAVARHPAAEWEHRLAAAGIPCAVQRTTRQWLSLPEPRAAGLLTDRDGVTAPGPAVWLDEPRAVHAHRPMAADVAALPLRGVRVVDLSSMIAGPVAARTLGQLGADVIKVDAPHPHHGPRMVCWYGIEVNRGKASVLLDLTDPGGASALREMIDHSDVVVENIRAEALSRLDLEPAALRARHPGLTWCSISAFAGPQGGPWAERRGYDPVLQAATGAMLRFGGDRPELHAVASCVDALTGYLAALATTASLLSRARHGVTWHARTSLAAGAQLAQLPFMLLDPTGDDPASEPTGPSAVGSGALQRLYRAGDGWLALGARPDQREAVLAALGCPKVEDERLAVDGPLAAEIADSLRSRSVEEAVTTLRRSAVGAHRVRTLAELPEAATDAPAAATVRVEVDQDHPAGTTVSTALPTSPRFFVRGPLRAGHAAPKPGADTRTVLGRHLGPEEAERLLRSGTAADQLSDTYLPA